MAITINGSGTIGGVSVGGLPDGIVDTDMLASGAITDALLPAGSVLQVVNTTQNGTPLNTTSSTLQASGFYIDITPISTSSKIYIIATFNTKVAYTTGGQGGRYTIKRNGTTNLFDQNEGQFWYTVNNIGAVHLPVTLHALDSPATTSSTRYEVYYCSFNSGVAGIENWGKFLITAMEIAG